MEGQEYLNQISATAKPTKKLRKNILSSKYFIFGAASVIVLILIMILGAILSAGKGDQKELSTALILHLNNNTELIEEYQPNIKSSDLRSDSSSLYSVITNTSKKLNDYLVEKYDFKEKNIAKNVVDAATQEREELNEELFKGKINGTLDRVFAHRMAFEISALATEEQAILTKTKDETLKAILTESHDSLTNLYNKFDSFSEAK